jgi:hypothetical protein
MYENTKCGKKFCDFSIFFLLMVSTVASYG